MTWHWQLILEKNQDIWNNHQDLLTMNPWKKRCDSFTITCLNFRWKYPLWMRTVGNCDALIIAVFLCLNMFYIDEWWQRIHSTLSVVDRYLRLMGDNMIPDTAEPRLESFYSPYVTGIDLPHQGEVDSYIPWPRQHYTWGHITEHQ